MKAHELSKIVFTFFLLSLSPRIIALPSSWGQVNDAGKGFVVTPRVNGAEVIIFGPYTRDVRLDIPTKYRKLFVSEDLNKVAFGSQLMNPQSGRGEDQSYLSIIDEEGRTRRLLEGGILNFTVSKNKDSIVAYLCKDGRRSFAIYNFEGQQIFTGEMSESGCVGATRVKFSETSDALSFANSPEYGLTSMAILNLKTLKKRVIHFDYQVEDYLLVSDDLLYTTGLDGAFRIYKNKVLSRTIKPPFGIDDSNHNYSFYSLLSSRTGEVVMASLGLGEYMVYNKDGDVLFSFRKFAPKVSELLNELAIDHKETIARDKFFYRFELSVASSRFIHIRNSMLKGLVIVYDLELQTFSYKSQDEGTLISPNGEQLRVIKDVNFEH